MWHLKACRVMINGDLEQHIYLSHHYTNNGNRDLKADFP